MTTRILIPCLFVIATAAAISCNRPEAAPRKEGNEVWDSIRRNLQTAPAVSENISESVKLNGKIQPNEERQAKVYALVSGKIKTVDVELGDRVTKGQRLATIQSTEVAGISNDLSMAESNVAMTKKNLESTKDLYQGNLATERDYINAQIEYNKAMSELNRAKQVSGITGGKDAMYELRSPLNGYITEKNITSNSQVRSDNNNNLFAVADLSNVWIIANVYETDINSIHLGDAVKVTTLANPDKEYDGRIDKIYNVLDPATRTMKVRISMQNPNNELKPEMFVTVKVNAQPSKKMLVIPSQAIVLDNSKNYVVLKQGNDLHVKEIKLIKRADDKAFVEGLADGDQVVINSQLFIYQALSND